MKKNLLVISSYPQKGTTHNAKIVGVASYAKNTISALPKDTKILVLAEKLDNVNSYKDSKNVSVKRIWKRKSLFSYLNLLWEISKRKEKNILFEFELSMFGGMFSLALLPLFLIALSILGKKTTLVFHQVITDAKEINGHLNLPKMGLKTSLMTIMLWLFYFCVSNCVSKIIVFEEILKTRLSALTNSKKITVIPHGVEEFKNHKKEEDIRAKLGIKNTDFVILCFGFLAWYKGTDWIVDAFSKTRRKNLKLVIAGGPNPNHKDKAYYQKYIKSIEEKCKKNNISLTGFVAEEEIPAYLKACDLAVFPYRTLMSSSGPLSMALSFDKPFIVSNKLNEIFETKDVKEILKDSKLDKEKIIFKTEKDLFAKIKAISADREFEQKLIELSSILRRERSWKKIGKKYYEEIFVSS